jgi:purine-binding chemotaxis protein CheW
MPGALSAMGIQEEGPMNNKATPPPHARLSERDAAIQRIAAAQDSLANTWTPSKQEIQRILKARALALAQEPAPVQAAIESFEVVEFVLAHERYAIESRFISEVAILESLTPLPCVPAFVLGVVNLRGEMLSVIDLKRFFELPDKGLGDLNKIIVLRSGEALFSVLADAIVGVRRIMLADIHPSLPTLTGIRKDYLKGITPERLIVLDAEKQLVDERIVVREEVRE